MTIYNIITGGVAIIALALSLFNFYYDRIYENEQLLVDFSDIKFEENSIDVSAIFINNSKKYYAIKSIVLELEGKSDDENIYRDYFPSQEKSYAFPLKPDEITVKYIKTPTGLKEIKNKAKNPLSISFNLRAKVYFLDQKGQEAAIIIPLYIFEIQGENAGGRGLHSGPIDVIKNANKTWDYSK